VKKLNLFDFNPVSSDLCVYTGAVNTGILKWGERAILIDCDDTLTPAALARLGINSVERIYCTQHRRPNTAGISLYRAEVYAPLGERDQFEKASAYWQDWHNRWHLYHSRPGPFSPLQDIPVHGFVQEGDTFQWGKFDIRVINTPGMTDGAVSYVVELHHVDRVYKTVVFSGDVLYGAGQVWDIHSLQKNMGTFSDYHGFLGAARTLMASLRKLGELSADCLIPSHGEIILEPFTATQFTIQRLEKLYRNYASISAINFYFPHIFQDLGADPERMPAAPVRDFPDFIRPVSATSFAIRSESGALFLIDCGQDSVFDTLDTWKKQELFSQLEGCWITHYHDDHVDALHHLAAWHPSVPIYADEHLAEILSYPNRFFLPCISPASAPVTHVTSDGETWRWHEFKLTALHFPGQTFYHGGLLLSGHGLIVLFCGDSFAPTGLDDYTSGNRNFLGAGKGYRYCIDLLRQHRPDMILNQHQQQAFRFTTSQMDKMEQMLVEREALLAELVPWDHPNFGTDEGWLRAYPYEMATMPGGTCVIEVRATNHDASKTHHLIVEAIVASGWEANSQVSLPSVGVEVGGEKIIQAHVAIRIPPEARGGLYPVAFRVTWDDRYLGQVCHALVKVC
jgi:glyoxylase-like metal-dependent hydrolase (beta-lactamase superfamily II)